MEILEPARPGPLAPANRLPPMGGSAGVRAHKIAERHKCSGNRAREPRGVTLRQRNTPPEALSSQDMLTCYVMLLLTRRLPTTGVWGAVSAIPTYFTFQLYMCDPLPK